MKKLNEVTKIFLDNGGDWSVGIRGFRVELEVKTDTNFQDDEKEGLEEFLKEKLKEFFEGYDGRSSVFTEKEYLSMIDEETAYLESLNEGK
jgi:hypothetical protein